jgi:hypothetical protein
MATQKRRTCKYGRKKSGACKSKPGPKRSRKCKRGRRKGTRTCKSKPGPKRSRRSRRKSRRSQRKSRRKSRRSRFRMQSGPDTRYPQWGCSGHNKAPCNNMPWCNYVKKKGCKKNSNFKPSANWKSTSSKGSVSDPNIGFRNIRKGVTPCSIDTKLPQARRQSLCYANPNCSWIGQNCKFVPKSKQGAASYGSYQGPQNLLPQFRPKESRKDIKKKWKEAARIARKRDKQRRKRAETSNFDPNPFHTDEELHESNPFRFHYN